MAAVKDFEWAELLLLYPGIGIETSPGDGFPEKQVQLMQWDGRLVGQVRGDPRRRRQLGGD